jgi:brefeldin A-resistance guanine nucleotide exchange factor 1
MSSDISGPIAAGLVHALLGQIPEDDQASVIAVKQDSVPPGSGTAQDHAALQPTYDPSVAYILEFCTILATRNDEFIRLIGKSVFDVVLGLLRDPTRWHPITLSRATFYALYILKSSYVRFSST